MTRGTSFRLKERRFRLYVRKSEVVRHRKSLLEEVVQGQVGWDLDHLDLMHITPAHARVDETKWFLRFFSTNLSVVVLFGYRNMPNASEIPEYSQDYKSSLFFFPNRSDNEVQEITRNKATTTK